MEIAKIFPGCLRGALAGDDWQEGLEEIRVRVGRPVEFLYDTGNKYLLRKEAGGVFAGARYGEVYGEESGMRMADIAEMLNYISNYSLYAYSEEVKQGYITIEGGHRIGLAGSVARENGEISAIHHVAFLNIRIAHEKKGCAEGVMQFIRDGDSVYNTLLLSEPGAGKTTLLRDCIRLLSTGTKEVQGMKVCVVDERSEIAACHLGVPQNDLGPRTDVLDGCGKAEGMRMLLRAMSPQVIAVDELGGREDFLAVEQALYSGSRVIGTIHAGSVRELSEKPFLQDWVGRQMFGRYIWIRRTSGGGRCTQVFDAHMERLC